MSWYIIIKFIHIVSATMMIGGSTANGIMELNLKVKKKFKKASEIEVIMSQVKLINTKIVFPSLITLLITGLILVYVMNISLLSKWIIISMILLVFIFVIYFVGKHNEDNLEKVASINNTQQMEKYHKRILIFGPLASIFIFTVLYLMIAKPY